MSRSPADPWPALLPLLLSVMLGSTSVSAVVIALPSLSSQLNIEASLAVWIVDAYPLALAATLVPGARLGDQIGRKRVLAIGLLVLAAGACLGGLAPNGEALLASRIVMGAAEGFVISSVVATIGAAFRPASRVLAYGAWTAAFGAGTAFGPLLGGLLTEGPGWRFLWWGAVPIALLALALALWLVPETTSPARPHWDATSVILCVVLLAGLSYAVHHLGSLPWVGAGVGALALAAGAWFVRRQLRLPDPLIEVRLFADAAFSNAYLRILAAMGASSGVVFVIGQHLQRQGSSPAEAGRGLLPLAVALAVGGLAAPLVARMGRQRAVLAFLLVQAAATAWLAIDPNAPWLAQVLIGLASGIISTLAAASLFDAARLDQAGQVGAVQEVAFALGAGFGIAAAGLVASAVPADPLPLTMALTAALLACAAALPLAVRGRRRRPADATSPATPTPASAPEAPTWPDHAPPGASQAGLKHPSSCA